MGGFGSGGIYVGVYCRETLAIVFGASGVIKLFGRPEFAIAIRGYRLIPEGLVFYATWIIPLAEVTTAIGLAGALALTWPCLAAAGLILVFTLAVAINLFRGNRNFACGCLGSFGHGNIGWGIVARNVLLGFGAIIPVLQNSRSMSDATGSIRWPELFVIFCLAAASVGIWWLGIIMREYPDAELE